MTQGPKDQFQIQLIDTTNPYSICARCDQNILPQDDSEHIVIWTLGESSDLRFHIAPCFGEFVEGMVQFFKIFIVEKRKKVKNAPFN